MSHRHCSRKPSLLLLCILLCSCNLVAHFGWEISKSTLLPLRMTKTSLLTQSSNVDAPSSSGYELIDFGDGMRLERFGDVIVARPCPAAVGKRALDHSAWSRAAQLTFQTATATATATTAGRSVTWSQVAPVQNWSTRFGRLHFHLDCFERSQIGLFPEQEANWRWIQQQVQRIQSPAQVLNAFAYTGGSTMASVVSPHVTVSLHQSAVRSVVLFVFILTFPPSDYTSGCQQDIYSHCQVERSNSGP
jgi:hypothetical protein